MSEPPLHVRVLDYDMGNVRSVVRALRAAGADVEVSPHVGGERLLLPGVGAFAEAVRQLGPRLTELKSFVRSGRPLLGICLGMQLLFEESHEHGRSEGIGHFQGSVEALPTDAGVSVPNMGWHRLQGLNNPFAYFAHSFGVRRCAEAIAQIDHGGPWVAAVRRERVWGFQFHPEKSGASGIRLIREWLAC